MELDLPFLEQWLEFAETVEGATGLKVALDRDIVRELIKRANELETIKRTRKWSKKPRS